MQKDKNTTDADGDSKNSNYKIINKNEKNRELELEVEIAVELVEKEKESALKELGKNVEVKGFRKGMAPTNLVMQEIGGAKIFEEQTFQAVNKVLGEIIMSEKIDAITQPKVSILKMAPNNPLVIKAVFILMPTVELPDYKKIAKNVSLDGDTEPAEKEISDYIEYLRKMKAESDHATHDHVHTDDEELVLPEFNDEFVKQFGAFKDVEDFKNKLKENIKKEKEEKTKQKRRVEIIEKIISEAKIELPEVLVEEEMEKMIAQYKGDIRAMKVDPEEYLKEIKKTEDDLRKEWKADAEKRAKMNFVLPRIAIEEKIQPDKEKVESEVKHIKTAHPEINERDAKIYFTQIYTNEEVFKFLENLK